jgi:hypothetical protein
METKKEPEKDVQDIGNSLVETIVSPELASTVQDLVEVGLDTIINDGVLRDIPIISTIIGTAKAWISVRDKLLLEKLKRFLQGIRVTEEDRNRFLDEINKNVGYKRKVGESLIMLLDHFDDMTKADMLAKLFTSHLRDDITWDEFRRFAFVIERVFIHDLNEFLEAIADDLLPPENSFAQTFYPLGLSRIKFDASGLKLKTSESSIPPKTSIKADSFNDLVKFEMRNETYVLAQILNDQPVEGMDFITPYREHRSIRE